MSTYTETRTGFPVGTWNLDAAHSHVDFAVRYTVGDFRGGFQPFEAKLDVGEDGAATLTGSAMVGDVRVQDENLTAHLQSPDFFDAERTPEVRFVTTKLERSGEELRGVADLTIRDVTAPVELRGTIGDPTVDPFGATKIGLTLETTVDRTRYGLNWNNPLPTGEPSLATDVRLTAELFLVKQER